MRVHATNQVFWLVGMAFLGTGLAVGGQTNDRVVFSHATNATIETPAASLREKRNLPTAPALGSVTAPAPIEVPVAPVNTQDRTPRRALQEMIDRHQNWAFLDAETALVNNPDSELESMDNSIEPPKASRSTLENYLDPNPQESSNRTTDKNQGVSPTLSPSFSISLTDRLDLRQEVARPTNLGLDPDLPTSLGTLSDTADKLKSELLTPASALSPVVYPGSSSPRSSANSSPTITPSETANTTRGRKPVSPLDATINLLPDLTSEPIQPVVGRSAAEVISNPGFVTGLDIPDGGARGERRQMDLLTSQVLGPSSLAPAFSAPVDTRQIRPLPAILEVPKRKF